MLLAARTFYTGNEVLFAARSFYTGNEVLLAARSFYTGNGVLFAAPFIPDNEAIQGGHAHGHEVTIVYVCL